MKKLLFIDRDGTLITDPPPSYQVDEFPKLEFYPEAIYYLGKIARELDYELVMISNQDGLGTEVFPDETFWPVQDFIMHTLANEKIHFKDVIIDRTFPSENNLTRKPGTALLKNIWVILRLMSHIHLLSEIVLQMFCSQKIWVVNVFI